MTILLKIFWLALIMQRVNSSSGSLLFKLASLLNLSVLITNNNMTQNQFLIIILMDNTSQQVPKCSLSFLVSGVVNRESLKIQLDFPKSALVLKVLSLLFDLAGERNSTLIA